MEFKQYLLNESQATIATAIGDLLNSLQELESNSGAYGTRELSSYVERIVNTIRGIIQSSWPKDLWLELTSLQKVAVNLSKSIDGESDLDLKSVISAAAEEILKISEKLKMPITRMP